MPFPWLRFARKSARSPRRRPALLTVEALDERTLPSATMVAALGHAMPGNVEHTVSFNGALYFIGSDGPTVGLYRSDGTAAGTTLVKDVAARDLANLNGTLIFDAYDPVYGVRLWKSDGTAAGTVPFDALTPSGPTTLLSSPTVANGQVFFTLGSTVNSLWRTDGTAAGTVQLDSGQKIVGPQQFTAVGGTLFFLANESSSNTYIPGLWKSDGTVKGTVPIKEFPAGGSYPSQPVIEELAAVKGTLFFTVLYSGRPQELWKSDGTAAGTVLVKAVSAAGLTNVNGTLFFTAGGQVWKSDGTAAGTVLVAQVPGNIDTGTYGGIHPMGYNGLLYFVRRDPVSLELWKSDGTAAGTGVLQAFTSTYYVGPGGLTGSGGALYFEASDAAHGAELWTSDGTAAGTTLVQDINPGPKGSDPAGLIDVNGTLFFTADDGSHGRELWKVAPAQTAGGPSVQVAPVKAKDGQPFSGVVATFSDPAGAAATSYTATITWGDGHSTAGTVALTGKGAYSVSGGNTYARAGSYPLSVKVSKAGSAPVTAAGTATVADSEWWAGRAFERVKVNQSATPVLGTVTDTNPLASAGDFAVTIDWGDGQTSAGLLRADPKGGFDLVGTHNYRAAGSFTLTATITEQGGDTVTIHPLIAVDP